MTFKENWKIVFNEVSYSHKKNGKPNIIITKGAHMMKDDYWKLFEKTGSISDYLAYACTSEESQLIGREEGVSQNESGDRNGNGAFCYPNWRI